MELDSSLVRMRSRKRENGRMGRENDGNKIDFTDIQDLFDYYYYYLLL